MSHHSWGPPPQTPNSNPWAKNPWQQPAPQKPARSKQIRKLILIGVAALVLIVAVWAVHAILERTLFSPQHTAEAYLQAVVDGQAEEALALHGPNVTDHQRQLATNEVYQAATERPDRYEILAVERDDSSARVTAELFQAGKAYPLSLDLAKVGAKGVFFSDWRLESGDVSGRIYYASGPASLEVNGVELFVEPIPGVQVVDVSDEDVDLDAETVSERATDSGLVLLPGTYSFSASEANGTLVPEGQLDLTITPGHIADVALVFTNEENTPAPDGTVEPETPPTPETQPVNTAKVLAEASRSIEQRLEACIADTHIRIADCEVASWEDLTWGAMTDIRRRWEQPPHVAIGPAHLDSLDEGHELDLTTYTGELLATVYDGTIAITYQGRDYEDEEWSEYMEWVYAPFESATGPFELPVTFNGTDIIVDYSPLDEFNPAWLKPERQH